MGMLATIMNGLALRSFGGWASNSPQTALAWIASPSSSSAAGRSGIWKDAWSSSLAGPATTRNHGHRGGPTRSVEVDPSEGDAWTACTDDRKNPHAVRYDRLTTTG